MPVKHAPKGMNDCPDCEGQGAVTGRIKDGGPPVTVKCSRCDGSGKLPPLKAEIAK